MEPLSTLDIVLCKDTKCEPTQKAVVNWCRFVPTKGNDRRHRVCRMCFSPFSVLILFQQFRLELFFVIGIHFLRESAKIIILT